MFPVMSECNSRGTLLSKVILTAITIRAGAGINWISHDDIEATESD